MEEKNNKNFHRRPHHRRGPHNKGEQKPAEGVAEKVNTTAPETAAQPKENGGGNNNRNAGRNNKKGYHNKHKRRPANRENTQNGANNEKQNDAKSDIAEMSEAVESEEIKIASLPEVEEIAPAHQKVEKSSVMVEVVGIRFKSSGKTYYFDPAGISATKGAHAIVETARGPEYGEVSLANTYVSESDIVPPLRPLVRIATEEDKKHNLENKEKEQQAFVTCNERILAHGLDMKLIDAQYTFDNSKLLFYFTSSGRVDFRELVKDLASVFKTRIELRQIGIRDEAKLIGGLGMCGRPLCCSLFLTDFGQVSIKMAKEQNLSLNSAKISGICGRLMCCLRYEHETYEYEIKRTPPVDSTVKTEDGIGTVTEISPLAGTVKVRLADKPDQPPKSYHRDNVTIINKK